MTSILLNFLKGNPISTHPMVYLGLGFIYLALVFNCILSLLANRIPVSIRILWLLAIILVPFAGMTAYILWNLSKCDFKSFKSLMSSTPPTNPA